MAARDGGVRGVGQERRKESLHGRERARVVRSVEDMVLQERRDNIGLVRERKACRVLDEEIDGIVAGSKECDIAHGGEVRDKRWKLLQKPCCASAPVPRV